MPDIAYLIGYDNPLRFSPDFYNRRDISRSHFSKIEETLRREGYDLPAPIYHVLVDANFPAAEVKNSERGIFSPFSRNDPDRGHSWDYRHRTVVVTSHGTIGNVQGYSIKEGNKPLLKAIHAYTGKGEYAYLRDRFTSPFFIITHTEFIEEIKAAFEELEIEVRLVGNK